MQGRHTQGRIVLRVFDVIVLSVFDCCTLSEVERDLRRDRGASALSMHSALRVGAQCASPLRRRFPQACRPQRRAARCWSRVYTPTTLTHPRASLYHPPLTRTATPSFIPMFVLCYSDTLSSQPRADTLAVLQPALVSHRFVSPCLLAH